LSFQFTSNGVTLVSQLGYTFCMLTWKICNIYIYIYIYIYFPFFLYICYFYHFILSLFIIIVFVLIFIFCIFFSLNFFFCFEKKIIVLHSWYLEYAWAFFSPLLILWTTLYTCRPKRVGLFPYFNKTNNMWT